MKNLRVLSLGLILSLSALPANSRGTGSSKGVAVGNYNVPVGDPTLQTSSNFEVTYNFKTTRNKVTEISFSLPLELVGNENSVTLKPVAGQAGQWADGAYVKGPCMPLDRVMACQLIYDQLGIDVEAAERFTRLNFGNNPAELERRLIVGKIFRSEPGGIIAFRFQNKISY